MNTTYDVAVVGAGIIGLGAAYAALKRGKRVVVVDESAQPQGATVRNFGHLCIGAQSGVAREYADAARGIWLELAAVADFWIRESGTHVVARHEDELALIGVAAEAGGIDVLSATETERLMPLRAGIAAGGGWIRTDLQTDPRTAAAAIRRYLGEQGVDFQLRTHVGVVGEGYLLTSRGRINAELIVVAVNHDIDRLFPAVAERDAIVRCALDMVRATVSLRMPLAAPLLTGWSMLRYARFAELDDVKPVRDRLHAQRPELAALDLNQMYTQLPDGSVIIGDTHVRGAWVEPFQPETALRHLLAETEALFDAQVSVRERWQGIYASGRNEFLVAEPTPGVVALAATTGIGMTCGLGLAENTLASRPGAPLTESISA